MNSYNMLYPTGIKEKPMAVTGDTELWWEMYKAQQP